ncbi:MAG: PAS domain-containing protein [Candidatus Thermoplasmatota archaeon]|nr:PAS domain-containing protein [Candidatus Thermoplasmatota archaeon]
MLSGLGLSVATTEFTIDIVVHYILFGSLLFVLLVDHRHTLSFPAELTSLSKEPFWAKMPTKKPSSFLQVRRSSSPFFLTQSFFSLFKHTSTKPEKGKTLHTKAKPTVRLAASLDGPLHGRQEPMTRPYEPISKARLQELDKKMKKLERLEDEIEHRRKHLVEQEKHFRTHAVVSHAHHLSVGEKKSSSAPAIQPEKRAQQNTSLLDEIHQCAAVIQRGFLKQMNDDFTQLLGYPARDLIGKNILDFIGPDGLAGFGKYYLNQLRGINRRSYDVVFVTKNNTEIPATIAIKPTLFKGEKADIVIVQKKEHQ